MVWLLTDLMLYKIMLQKGKAFKKLAIIQLLKLCNDRFGYFKHLGIIKKPFPSSSQRAFHTVILLCAITHHTIIAGIRLYLSFLVSWHHVIHLWHFIKGCIFITFPSTSLDAGPVSSFLPLCDRPLVFAFSLAKYKYNGYVKSLKCVFLSSILFQQFVPEQLLHYPMWHN